MNAEDNRKEPTEPITVTSFAVLGSHLFWVVLGPLVLLLLLWGTTASESGWVAALDIAFFVVVASMIFGRWLDQRSGQGTTSAGEQSTWRDFRRYAWSLPIVAASAWIVANLLGNHVLDGG